MADPITLSCVFPEQSLTQIIQPWAQTCVTIGAAVLAFYVSKNWKKSLGNQITDKTLASALEMRSQLKRLKSEKKSGTADGFVSEFEKIRDTNMSVSILLRGTQRYYKNILITGEDSIDAKFTALENEIKMGIKDSEWTSKGRTDIEKSLTQLEASVTKQINHITDKIKVERF